MICLTSSLIILCCLVDQEFWAQCNPLSAVGEPGEHLSLVSLESLEAMSEGEAPSAFTRGIRSRASLPVVKSNNQTKDRSLGKVLTRCF